MGHTSQIEQKTSLLVSEKNQNSKLIPNNTSAREGIDTGSINVYLNRRDSPGTNKRTIECTWPCSKTSHKTWPNTTLDNSHKTWEPCATKLGTVIIEIANITHNPHMEKTINTMASWKLSNSSSDWTSHQPGSPWNLHNCNGQNCHWSLCFSMCRNPVELDGVHVDELNIHLESCTHPQKMSMWFGANTKVVCFWSCLMSPDMDTVSLTPRLPITILVPISAKLKCFENSWCVATWSWETWQNICAE